MSLDNPNEIFNTQGQDPNTLKAILRAKADLELKQLQAQRAKIAQPSQIESSNPTPETAGASAGLSTDSPFGGKFKISQGYGVSNPKLYSGVTSDAKHHGVDFATPEGTQIKSPIAGDVEVGQNKWYGNYVKIKAPDGTTLQFSHLSSVDDLLKQVEQKKQVLQGQLLGLSGNTGYSTGAHTDVMAWQGGKQIDPMTLQAFQNARL